MAEHHTLDARRLLCPMPVIRVQNKISDLSSGDVLEVWCTDPGTRSDIPAWCRINGHRVVDITESDGELVLTLEVGETKVPGTPYD
ncbi:MAG: sulfurtransferase TusA family protein [Gammaproteobacteria bacterium]|jgi:tRNA 2-thiouridine synthesizing protein A|nr:sulfurtransferase TusA family protein [Gammaproteobacteria bacterium]MDX2462303.1 sulfurtransferase TusA family protein [Gammaproteobacteria bacterium]